MLFCCHIPATYVINIWFLFFRAENVLCCKLPYLYLAAILDAMVDVRLSDYQMTIILVLMDSLTPKTMLIDTQIQSIRRKISDL